MLIIGLVSTKCQSILKKLRLFSLEIRAHLTKLDKKKLSGIWIYTPLKRKDKVKYLGVLFGPPVRRTESPINSCPSVRPYISNTFFSELVHLIFLILCMKLEIHKCEKVTKPDFLGKFSFAQIWAKRAQKCTFLLFLKIRSLVFSDIVHEVRGL